ncbi:NrfD/PsrC family molybdoenzyme membrane anchor subunit [Natronobacterium gregoryi]|uniref:Polysulfide reductase n=2 Tax=Natronobacterium gregoryi TaxID=44930 RepID=L0ALU1_NATGS|nr:NrfD/PsrC family molybdoenzyme membrane anchor subunit [Natronobacterium gregoryi]AFZ74429.1 polysulfide reductase [Natronobacterium gregoryi SP2]ELY72111.1 polysulfide reductase NrfD [Natronobacterium gregoryi SP2]PLK19758.1 polysulfide reductase NrfD [Natronobacterium gregoryi SP2]SFJ40812.1 prokaryotic molybdopterin-containing oxidoreductase family, membrane subunit [Natronobacterium gregoryi]
MSQSTQSSAGPAGGEHSSRFYAWLAAIAVGLVVGLYGVVTLLLEGTAALGIDSQLPLGILLSTYEFFLMMSAGIMIGVIAVAAIFGISKYELVLKRGIVLSLATLAAGLFTIVIGLGRPERPAIQVFLSPNLSSPIWWMIMAAGLFGITLLALLYLLQWSDVDSRRPVTIVGVIGLLAGISVVVFAGMIFGLAETRPYYGGPLAPIYFLITGVMSGIAAMGLVTVAEYKATGTELGSELGEFVTKYVGGSLAAMLGLTIFAVAVKVIYGLTATSTSVAMAYEHMLLNSSFAPIYWLVGIVVGLIVPLALLLYPGTRTPNGVLAASAMALVGLFVTRYEFVVGGQVVSLTNDPSLQYPLVSYVPSGVELAIVVFAFALAALVYTVGQLLIDLDELPASLGDAEPATATPASAGGDDDD